MRNIVHQLKIKNLDLTADYVQSTSNFIESPMLYEKTAGDEEMTRIVELREKMIDEFDAAQSLRMIKSHLPAYLLPNEVWTVQPKIIYTSRDVKDVAVSLYHMRQKAAVFNGTISEYFDILRNDFDIFSPYYEHIASYHQLRQSKHLLLLTYEEMSKNTFEIVKRVSEFLECSYSDEQLQQLVEHVSFEKMREKVGLPTATHPNFK